MNMTTMKHLSANMMIMTHHIRHIFMPINQTINESFMQHYILLIYHFKPIHQTMLVENKQELVLLLQHSIPFTIDLVYLLVQLSKFSLHSS